MPVLAGGGGSCSGLSRRPLLPREAPPSPCRSSDPGLSLTSLPSWPQFPCPSEPTHCGLNHLSIHISNHLSIHAFIHLSIHQPLTFYPSIHPPIHSSCLPTIHPSICPFILPSYHPSIHHLSFLPYCTPSLHLPLHPFIIYPCIHPFTYPFIH